MKIATMSRVNLAETIAVGSVDDNAGNFGLVNILWQRQIKVERLEVPYGKIELWKRGFEKVGVCGIECEFNDMRIDKNTIPKGKYQYEVAGDDNSGGDLARVQSGVLVNFCGTLICDKPLPVGNYGILWLMDGI